MAKQGRIRKKMARAYMDAVTGRTEHIDLTPVQLAFERASGAIEREMMAFGTIPFVTDPQRWALADKLREWLDGVYPHTEVMEGEKT